VYNSNNLRLV